MKYNSKIVTHLLNDQVYIDNLLNLISKPLEHMEVILLLSQNSELRMASDSLYLCRLSELPQFQRSAFNMPN